MFEILECNIDDYGCIGHLCPYKESCYVGIAQNETCLTNAEAEETVKMIMKPLTKTLLHEYGIAFEREDNAKIVKIIKNYVIHEQIRSEDIEDVQCETLGSQNAFLLPSPYRF